MDFKREMKIKLDSTVDGILRIKSKQVPNFVEGTKLENVYRQYLIMCEKSEVYEDFDDLETYAEASDFIVSMKSMKKNLLALVDSMDKDIKGSDGKLSDEAINNFHDFSNVLIKSIVFDEIETKEEYLRAIVTYICLTFMAMTVVSTDE